MRPLCQVTTAVQFAEWSALVCKACTKVRVQDATIPSTWKEKLLGMAESLELMLVYPPAFLNDRCSARGSATVWYIGCVALAHLHSLKPPPVELRPSMLVPYLFKEGAVVVDREPSTLTVDDLILCGRHLASHWSAIYGNIVTLELNDYVAVLVDQHSRLIASEAGVPWEYLEDMAPVFMDMLKRLREANLHRCEPTELETYGLEMPSSRHTISAARALLARTVGRLVEAPGEAARFRRDEPLEPPDAFSHMQHSRPHLKETFWNLVNKTPEEILALTPSTGLNASLQAEVKLAVFCIEFTKVAKCDIPISESGSPHNMLPILCRFVNQLAVVHSDGRCETSEDVVTVLACWVRAVAALPVLDRYTHILIGSLTTGEFAIVMGARAVVKRWGWETIPS